MLQRQQFSEILYWIAAIVFALVPPFLACDFGGILPWSQFVSALVLAIVCMIVIVARLISVGCPLEIRLSTRAFAISGWLCGLIIWTALQTIACAPRLVAWLSPASHAAYVDWIGEWNTTASVENFPISLAPVDSRHSIAYLSIALLMSFFATLAFHNRGRTTWLLTSISLAACSVVAIGLARKLVPSFQLWSFQSGGEGAPFGTFLNRNNAAFAINLGIASALGLFVWRSKAGTDPRRSTKLPSSIRSSLFAAIKWRTIVADPFRVASLLSIGFCLIGLIACGSRGGLLSAIIAGAAVVWIQRGKLGQRGYVIGAVIAMSLIVFALLRTDVMGNQVLQDNTLTQIGATVQTGSDRLSADTRLQHWPDGFRAALHHFPAGSGLATYGFAYLPWQQTSPWRHCLHADNLWLEMLVELGLVGVVLTVVALWMLVRCFRRLQASPDPIDQGLSITGYYLVMMLMVSQMFDFGLIVPANLITVVMILPVIMARSTTIIVRKFSESSGKPRATTKPKLVLRSATEKWWNSPVFLRERLVQGVCGVGVMVISVFALQRLRYDTQVDYLVRTVDSQLSMLRADEAALKKLSSQIEAILQRDAHPDLFDSLFEVHFQRGRLLELSLLGAGRLPDSQQSEWYRSTSRVRRRLGWRASVPDLGDRVSIAGKSVRAFPLDERMRSSDSPYVLAMESAQQSLHLRPLAMRPRINQVYIEFVGQNPDRSNAAIEQSAQLFRNTPELQLRLGTLAADQGDFDLASECWRRAATLDEKMVTRVLGRAIHYAGFPVRSTVPDNENRKQKAEAFLNSLNYQE